MWNLVSRKANLSLVLWMSDLRNAASVRLIQVWTLFLSKLGSSGFLSARTWLVWLARAADTAASVASLDWRSLSSLSCLRAMATALAVIR